MNKYLKCRVWRLAVRYDIYILYIYIYMSLGGKRLIYNFNKMSRATRFDPVNVTDWDPVM
jgi:hypothetical protein